MQKRRHTTWSLKMLRKSLLSLQVRIVEKFRIKSQHHASHAMCLIFFMACHQSNANNESYYRDAPIMETRGRCVLLLAWTFRLQRWTFLMISVRSRISKVYGFWHRICLDGWRMQITPLIHSGKLPETLLQQQIDVVEVWWKYRLRCG